MPRVIQITLPPDAADRALRRLAELDGVVGVERHRGASIQPPGDVIAVQTTNDAAPAVFRCLDELDVPEVGSIATSAPSAIIAPASQDQLDRESNEATWEEIAFLMGESTNVRVNYLAQMMVSGAAAAVGLWSDQLHFVIGAMLIAPAFEPLVRISYGFAAGTRRQSLTGVYSTAAGFGTLLLGAFLALQVLRVVDPAASADIAPRQWVGFWSSFSGPGVLASLLGAIGGGITVATRQAVFATGVMVLLAVVPSMSIAGMALGTGDLDLAGRALLRWLADAGLILVSSGAVLVVKRRTVHRRRALRSARS